MRTKSKSAAERACALERPRVIVVEDEDDFRAILCGWLAPTCDIVSLPHGESLLDEALECAPDLFILDVSLPGPDGFALCRKIRSDPRLATTPVLFLTAIVSTEAFLRGLEAGGTAHLTKPVHKQDLLAKIGELLENV